MPKSNEHAPFGREYTISRFIAWFLEPFISEIKGDFNNEEFQQRFDERQLTIGVLKAAMERYIKAKNDFEGR